MAHTRSAEKRLRQTEKRRLRNRAAKSAIKTQLKKREGKTRGRKAAQVTLNAPVAANGSLDLLGTLEAIKQLVEEHGAESVKRMVDLVG